MLRHPLGEHLVLIRYLMTEQLPEAKEENEEAECAERLAPHPVPVADVAAVGALVEKTDVDGTQHHQLLLRMSTPKKGYVRKVAMTVSPAPAPRRPSSSSWVLPVPPPMCRGFSHSKSNLTTSYLCATGVRSILPNP